MKRFSRLLLLFSAVPASACGSSSRPASGIGLASNPYIRERRLHGEARNVGHDTNLDFELPAACRPDLMPPYGATGKTSAATAKHRKPGRSYIIYKGKRMEESPQGKTEWPGPTAGLLDLRTAGDDTPQRIARNRQLLKASPAATPADGRPANRPANQLENRPENQSTHRPTSATKYRSNSISAQ
nr:hypothetical protein [Alistipes sp.]